MPRFIQILQIILAVVIGSFIGYDLIFARNQHLNEKYVTITCVLWRLLEIAIACYLQAHRRRLVQVIH